ncbi:superoxide dismutase family protein [Domibacillus epiphyticus]|uniref:Superoxide dismutase [Cu-Zn] n=1 Tax=Domibacillus epiphyticus TaxID=1714355 RepID=A0A1V2A8Q0_9BACI|nr:superoxide dismutase family protein [Domibacillus epiphyticus]OMP67232.1 superoxide dismutase [Domibacillus epiphyticus]
MKRWPFFLFVFAIILLLGACSDAEETEISTEDADANTTTNALEESTESTDGQQSVGETATAELTNGSGEKIGTAELQQTDKGVLIRLQASDLTPGTHGFHIHETGKCEAPDFESAGGHFNPTDASHGFNHEEGPHAGDLPNIEVAEDGRVQEEVTAEHVTLEGGKNNSLFGSAGTAFVIHEKADDNQSQPSGNAGARIACGVISE